MIGIIDYGMGNLHSVQNALNYLEKKSFVSDDPQELKKADKLILPGVGAFPAAMKTLTTSGLSSFIKDAVSEINAVPLLGICLGMQLLFNKSYEFKECIGLSLIKGEVIKMNTEYDGIKLKSPHMGWNKLYIDNSCPILTDLPEDSFVYFVHSYKAVGLNDTELAAHTVYDGSVTAVVSKNNIYGTQFHPEKSGEIGLKILNNFASL